MTEEIQAKIEKLLEDQNFIAELLQQENEEEVAALLAKEGLDMPKEAVQSLMGEISKAVNEGLSDEELDAVSGGVSQDSIANSIDKACDFIKKNSKQIARGAVQAWNAISKLFKKKKC